MARSLQAFREPVYRIIDPVVQALVRWGVHPNVLTTVGFVVTLGAGWLFHLDRVRLAGLLILLAGLVDIFDGRVARESGLASKFGSFYDSTLDRLSEIVLYLGLLSLYNYYGATLMDLGMIYVVLLAMGGSMMVSYTRARAEALGLECSVGVMQRAERLVLLGGTALFFGLRLDGLPLKLAILAVAVLSLVTTAQRIIWVHGQAGGVPLDESTRAAEPVGDTEIRSRPGTGKGGA